MMPPNCKYCVNSLLTISNPICEAHLYIGRVCGGYREDEAVTNNLHSMLTDYRLNKDTWHNDMRRAVEDTLRHYDLID